MTSELVGLTSDEAARLLRRHGPNMLVPEGRRSRVPAWLRGSLRDPMVLLLLVAAPTYALLGDRVDAAIVLAALVPITGIEWILSVRADKALAALRSMEAPTARVWRDGVLTAHPSVELVPGDRIELSEGDIVPADGVVVSTTQLDIDESALTGESLPVSKVPAEVDATPSDSAVWAGTTVVSGQASVDLLVTGPTTRWGAIGDLVSEVRPTSTPLQRQIARVVTQLSAGALAVCFLVIGIERAHGRGWGPALIAGVSLAIAAVPEEFATVYSLYLALGARRLARDQALVRHLPAVETLGSCTVICTDKTGTLTTGGLVVSEVIGPGVLAMAILASEPDASDPLDAAVLAFARSHASDLDGPSPEALRGAPLVRDHSFDPVRRRVTHVRLLDGAAVTAVKGAVEGIMALCPLDEPQRSAALKRTAQLAGQGMRVLGVAAGPAATSGPTDRSSDESCLRWLGLIAFHDPVRPGVPDAIASCLRAGVRIVMITGDHPDTARAIAAEILPVSDGGPIPMIDVLLGDDFDGHDFDGHDVDRVALLPERLGPITVIARARPEHKYRVVQELRRRGEIVAMTGDGVNDAPALRAADIGVAMGRRGTEVARAAAAIILVDDNFTTLVTAVRDGRRIRSNLQRAFAYLVAFHIPLVVAAVVVPMLGRPLLLEPVHLILLELVLHPVISLAFESDEPAGDVMDVPPRNPQAGFVDRSLVVPVIGAIVVATATVAVYLARGSGSVGQERDARALGLALLLVGQQALIGVVRRGQRFNRMAFASTLAVGVVTLAIFSAAPLRSLLHVAPLPAVAFVAVLISALIIPMSGYAFARRDRGATTISGGSN